MQANRLKALVVARKLRGTAMPATLATVLEDGAPFASYVLSAPGPEGRPILLLSRLALHTTNLLRDSRASLLLVRGSAEPGAATARLTLVGRAIEHPDQSEAASAFLAHHPQSGRYASFGDFRYFAFQASTAHVVAGFGIAATVAAAELDD